MRAALSVAGKAGIYSLIRLLGGGNATVILKPKNEGASGFRLESIGRAFGDAGFHRVQRAGEALRACIATLHESFRPYADGDDLALRLLDAHRISALAGHPSKRNRAWARGERDEMGRFVGGNAIGCGRGRKSATRKTLGAWVDDPDANEVIRQAMALSRSTTPFENVRERSNWRTARQVRRCETRHAPRFADGVPLPRCRDSDYNYYQYYYYRREGYRPAVADDDGNDSAQASPPN